MNVQLLTAATQWGGLEEQVVMLASTLEARGHEVAIVELGRNGFARRKNARGIPSRLIHVPLDKSGKLDTPLQRVSWLAWRRIFHRLHADVGVFIKGGYEVGSWRLEAAASRCFTRYVTIEQLACPMPVKRRARHVGGLLPGAGLWWYRTLWRRRLRSLWPDAVVCVSEAVKRPLAEHYGFARRKLVTVHNGIDTGRFRRDLSWRHTTRMAWGIPPDALVFGAVGRLDPVKGYDIAIEAFATLTRHSGSRDMRLVLVGDGPSRPDLERLARQTGLSDRILFPGFTDRAHEAYPGLDVFVMPSLNEGLPLALVEAMASECCPIATDVGGVPEVITDSTLGWVVPSGDRSRFAGAMHAAASLDSQGMAQMGLRAREHVASRFDARATLAAIADVIERVPDNLNVRFSAVPDSDRDATSSYRGRARREQS